VFTGKAALSPEMAERIKAVFGSARRPRWRRSCDPS